MSGIRRNISGMFFFDTLPGEERRQPTCFEDCTEETQQKILKDLDPEAVKQVALHMASCLKNICEQFDIQSGE
jgi:hypothetical protein